MKRIITALAAAFALVAFGGTKIATQDWVEKQIRALKWGESTGTASVKTLENGSLEIRSKVTLEDLPQATEVAFIVSRTGMGSNLSRPTLLSAVPTIREKVQIKVESGYWVERDGAGNETRHPFNFSNGDPLTLEAEYDFPEMPDENHEHVRGPGCRCVDYGKTEADVVVPREYDDWDVKKLASELGGWRNWIDTDPPPGWIATRTRRENGRDVTYYYLQDDDGVYLNLDNLEDSDAWVRALKVVMDEEINPYLADCRDAYRRAHVCTEDIFIHDFLNPDECGGVFCKYCGSQKPDTTIVHTNWRNIGNSHRCGCGRITEAHDYGEWSQVSETADSITFRHVCKVCPATGSEVHTHTWTDCHTCDTVLPTGRMCMKPCRHCNGSHKFEGTTCHACTCPGCTIIPEDISYHTGWHECSEDFEDDNDDGTAGGAHCACACGLYGHNAGTGHEYGNETYQQKEPDDPEQHWFSKWCSRCGHHHARNQNHNWKDKPSYYHDDGEDVCTWGISCESCGYLKEEEHEHDWGGEPKEYADGGEDVCIWKWECKHCHRVKREEHSHVADDAPSRCEYVDEYNHRNYYRCKNCHRKDVSKGLEGHDRTSHCKCPACDKQLEHEYSFPNECGILTCRYCRDYDPDHPETKHKYFGRTWDATYHYCACKGKHKKHNWTEWKLSKIDTSRLVKIYNRHCQGDWDDFGDKCEDCHRVEEMEQGYSPEDGGESGGGSGDVNKPGDNDDPNQNPESGGPGETCKHGLHTKDDCDCSEHDCPWYECPTCMKDAKDQITGTYTETEERTGGEPGVSIVAEERTVTTEMHMVIFMSDGECNGSRTYSKTSYGPWRPKGPKITPNDWNL